MDQHSYGKSQKKKIKNLKSKLKFNKVKQKLKDPEVIFCLTILQK